MALSTTINPTTTSIALYMLDNEILSKIGIPIVNNGETSTILADKTSMVLPTIVSSSFAPSALYMLDNEILSKIGIPLVNSSEVSINMTPIPSEARPKLDMLPNEVLTKIALPLVNSGESPSLLALVQTNRHFSSIFSKYLYDSASKFRSATGIPPLHWAIIKNQPLVFTRLLSCENLNALLSRVNKLYQTALHLAIKHNRDTKIFITPLLPLIEERDSLGRTPLHTAVLSPTTSFSTITFLLENGAPVSNDDDTLRTPLHLALALPTPPKSSIISTLVEHDPDVSTIPDKFKKTPLHLAASNGHLSAIRILLDTLEAQSIINTLDTKQHSPLWLAAERGHEKVVETLLDFGATDPYGEALYAAALTGRVGVVKMLMRRAPVGRMRSGLCPLRAAAEMGWREVCEELWRAGVMKRFKRGRGRKGKYAGAEHYAEVVLEECKLERGAK